MVCNKLNQCKYIGLAEFIQELCELIVNTFRKIMFNFSKF